RNPLLWLVPALLLPLLVAIGAVITSRQSEVKATIWTQVPSLVDTVTPAETPQPPAKIEAATFNERLSTESFRASILSAAGLDDQVAQGKWPGKSGLGSLLAKLPFFGGSSSSDAETNRNRALAAVKASLSAEAPGNNLMYIVYVGGDADVGVALVNGAIETYQNENQKQSSAALDFYATQVAELQQELVAADSDLRAYQAEHPAAAGAPVGASEAQLQSVYNIRLSQYELAMNRQSDAQWQASLTSTNSDFSVVDPPRAPLGSALNRPHAAMLTFLGVVLGVGLGGLLIALRTWFDQVVRRAEDVQRLLGLELLAVVPDLRKGGE
ncbi:MAG: hypothetical protein ABR978_08990, partial [Dehalococcoidia bacterium]